MITFRVNGTDIRIEFSFLAVWALLLSIRDSGGLEYSLYAVLVHETAHILVMAAFHIGLREITFHGCGIRIRPQTTLASYSRELAVLMAGPLANITMWLILHAAGPEQAAGAQLILGVFNLLPCSRLDGGAVLSCILAASGLAHCGAERILRFTAVITVLAAAAAGLMLGVKNFTYYALMLYLFFSEIF